MTVHSPLIVGEVLYDVFPDQQKILGGAPFNVAWHLQALGLQPVLFSRIGDDSNGRNILHAMQCWHLDTGFIQQDNQLPTGTVDISQHPDGSHSFNINDHQAWDNLAWDDQLSGLNSNNTCWLYHGSLALRHKNNNSIIDRLRKQGLPVFLDINLRNPWWSHDQIKHLMRQADWIKLNDEETALLTGCDLHAPDWRSIIPQLHQEYSLQGLIVTCGAAGAWLFDGKQLIFEAPPALDHLRDTVGAGDAFTAICLLGLSKQWPLKTILHRALMFAADVCQIQGATSSEPDFYQKTLNQWQ